MGQTSNKAETQSLLKSIWVHQQDEDLSSFRPVRANEYLFNTRGLIFPDSGLVEMYVELGCQLKPHFKPWLAKWEVKRKNLVIVDRKYPGEKPDRMKILAFYEEELIFCGNKSR